MSTFDADQQVSSAELARVFGLTERRIQQLEAESVFENVGRGRSKRYVLADAVQAMVRRSEIAAAEAVQGASTSREMFEAERARKLKLQNDQSEALLVETPDALAAIDAIFGEVRTALAGIPARFTEDLAERRRLEDAIDTTLADLTGRLDKAGAALAEGRDPLAADEENHA